MTMEEKLTKKQAARAAAKLLLNIYDENLNVVATIIDAEAKVREGDDEGAKTLADGLNSAMVFMEKLVVELKREQ